MCSIRKTGKSIPAGTFDRRRRRRALRTVEASGGSSAMRTNGNRAARRRAVAVAAALIVAAGCNSSTESEPDGTPPTTSTATTSTTSSTPDTSTTSTSPGAPPTTVAPTSVAPTTAAPPPASEPPPVTTASPACPAAPPLAPGAADLTSAGADVDGDGLADLVSTYVVPAEGRWHVRIEFGVGGSADATIADSGMVAPARPLGGHDVDGDGTDEVFLTVGSGASAVLVGLYDVAGCALARVTAGPEPAVFPIGATVGNVSGLSCDGVGDLDRLFAQEVAADLYEGGFEPYTLSGNVLTVGIGDGATFTAAEAGALAVLDCGSLDLP
jgi:hypothetical protein